MARLPVFVFSALLLLMGFPLIGIEKGGGPFTYVGSKECKDCHGEDAIGNQYKIWESSPHAKAYDLLIGEKAGIIAE